MSINIPEHEIESKGRRMFLNLAFSGMVATLLSVSSSKEDNFQSRGVDLSNVHQKTYDSLMTQMEATLNHNRVRVTGFYGRILREQQTKIYTLEYVVKTETVTGEENPHHHIELVSTVWRAKDVGKTEAKQEQERKWQHFSHNFSLKYPNTPYRVLRYESGDSDLYEIGYLVVW